MLSTVRGKVIPPSSGWNTYPWNGDRAVFPWPIGSMRPKRKKKNGDFIPKFHPAHLFSAMAKSMVVRKVGYTAHCHTVQNPNARIALTAKNVLSQIRYPQLRSFGHLASGCQNFKIIICKVAYIFQKSGSDPQTLGSRWVACIESRAVWTSLLSGVSC